MFRFILRPRRNPVKVSDNDLWSRRRFLAGAGSGVGLALCGKYAQGQDATQVFVPCVDYPVRKSPSDPTYLTPIERVIALQNVQPSSAPRVTTAAALPEGAAQVSAKAPTRFGALPTGPSRFAAKNRWMQKTVGVAFEAGTSESLISKVLEIASEWTQYTGVNLQRSHSASAEIRVGFQTQLGFPDSGHWSYVGPDSLPQFLAGKSMNLAINEESLETRAYDRSVVLHEFGHAMGLMHEHQSPGKGGILFDPGMTVAYFQQLCGWDRDMTYANVINRYDAHDLKMFSDFDPKSIMLYQYPAEITKNHQGTDQNYVLSDTDKEFTCKLYDRAPPPKTNETTGQPATTDTTSPTQALSLDGPRLAGAITPATSRNNYTFEITANRTYTLVTDGYTQVALQLFKDEAAINWGKVRSPDLVNLAMTATLPTGKYRVEVRHRYDGGVGEYGIRLVTGGG
jgi:hypothetical protein